MALKSSARVQPRSGRVLGLQSDFPENAEATFTNSINENTNQFTDWTWSNTARYDHKFDRQPSRVAGQEANASNNRFIRASMSNLLNRPEFQIHPGRPRRRQHQERRRAPAARAPCCRCLRKVGYNYADKYVASATVRRDGSSNLGPGHRWGTFPAFGLGWRLTNEPLPGEATDLLGRHASLWIRRDGKPEHPVGAHRLAIWRRPRRYLLRHHGKQHQRSGRIPADVVG